MSLKDLSRRVDFVLILITGLLFLGFCIYQDFIHNKTFIGRYNGYKSVTLGGVGIFMVSGFFSHARWKFVYGSEEHRRRVRENIRPCSRGERIRSGMIWGTLPLSAIIIILNFILFVAAVLNNLYLISLIPLGLCIAFCAVFYFFYICNINF